MVYRGTRASPTWVEGHPAVVQGYDTASAAESLRVTQKTVNAHVSNILTKLGLDTRAQYVATLIAHHEGLAPEPEPERAAEA